MSVIELKDSPSKRYSIPVEIKELKADGTVTGYGSVFGVEDSYGDIVEKGAFERSLKDRMPKMLYQHNSSDLVGKWTVAREDSKGLYLEGKIMENLTRGAEVLTLLREEILDGLSIGFRTRKARWDDKTEIRHLLELDLLEVSFVTFPALEVALVNGVKSSREFNKREVEQYLRDAGLPSAFAKKLLSGGWDLANKDRSTEHRDDGMSGILAALKAANNQMKQGIGK